MTRQVLFAYWSVFWGLDAADLCGGASDNDEHRSGFHRVSDDRLFLPVNSHNTLCHFQISAEDK
jgi:hypothetical protein